MKRILLLVAMLVLPLMVTAQRPKKVAVWETETKSSGVSPLKMELVRSGLEEAVDYTPGYVKYDRAKFEDVLKEHKFQRSGAVKDDDVKRMGEYAGVQFVIVPQVEMDGMDFLIVARVIDVETGESKTRKETCEATPSEIDNACSKLAARLLGFSDGGTGTAQHPSGNSGSSTSRGQDFTETAFGINMRMIYVEGGTFTMGCTREQGDCKDDEKNVRSVTLDGYYIGMLEVSQAQWEKVMGMNLREWYDVKKRDFMYIVGRDLDRESVVDWFGEEIKDGDTVYPSPYWPAKDAHELNSVGSNYPMYLVSWYDACDFCKLLSEKTGKNYMLPTEAQWEYAARGGAKNEGVQYSGSNMIENVAWYKNNSKESTHVCGILHPNALGLYDMSGNVEEWCRDVYTDTYLSYDTKNPIGPELDDQTGWNPRVIRGGGFWSDSQFCRVSCRSSCDKGCFGEALGFRVVLVP